MELTSPELPSVETLPSPAIPIIELSSTVTSIYMAILPPIPEYYLSTNPTYEDDPSKETSTAASHVPGVTEPSRACRVEVFSKEPHIINAPFVPRGWSRV